VRGHGDYPGPRTGGTTFIQRWLARLAFVAIAAALRREAIPDRLREHPALPWAWPSRPRDRLRQPLVMDRNYHVQEDEILRGTPTISKTSELTKKREGVSGYDRSVP